MIRVENIEAFNFEGAIRGMRNPMNSWDKSDSEVLYDGVNERYMTVIGENDLDLMRRLYKAGTEHRKYLRQIFVSMDITAPLYWWKEMDQYRINVTTNSCSTMHKIAAKEFELDDFSHEHLFGDFEPIEKRNEVIDPTLLCLSESRLQVRSDTVIMLLIELLNFYRGRYLETKDKEYWWQMIQLLPSSYNQKRTITMNYENVVNILKQRCGHKLDEWIYFCEELSELPYIREILNAE